MYLRTHPDSITVYYISLLFCTISAKIARAKSRAIEIEKENAHFVPSNGDGALFKKMLTDGDDDQLGTKETDAKKANDNHELLKHVRVLRDILRGKLSTKVKIDDDTSDSMLYLSRFSFGAAMTSSSKNFINQKDDITVGEAQKVEPVVQTSHMKEKRRQIATSIATIISREDRHQQFVQEGGIPLIMALASSGDSVLHTCCSFALSVLSAQDSYLPILLENSVTNTLVELCMTSSLKVKQYAIGALCNISCGLHIEERVAKDGGLQATIQVLQSKNGEQCIDIALALCLNCSNSKEAYARLEDVMEMLNLVTNGNYLLTDHLETVVLSTMNNLTTIRNNQLRLVEDGALRIIDRGLYSPLARLRVLGANCLRNLSTDSR
jgi:hypothetical protein